MIRIAIVGLGGVGGFIGGLLAHKYKNSGNIEITFICRGEHKKNSRNRFAIGNKT